MAFSDGDPFVSGSLYSFQQGNRMMQNYRGATVPSNLQAGALWSDSDDDRLWHQGASLDEVFTEKTTLTWENLLSNSGFGVWSQSDASKGLATITYDAGSKGGGAAPSVGDAVVGGTSGATAKIISYTILTGAFADNDATGVLTVGAVSHDFAFVDNETLTFAATETCLVNMPSSAVGVGLVQNGGFAADEDPPNGWDAGASATLTTEAGGQVGNCLKVARNAENNPYTEQEATGLTIGKIYKFSIYFKHGDATQGFIYVGSVQGGAQYFEKTGLTDAGWTQYTITFEATTTSAWIKLIAFTSTGTEYELFDEITLYEITPCCTGGDALAMDGWIKDSTADIYREHSGSNVKDGSFYANKLVITTAADYVRFPGAVYDNAEWYMQFQGRTVTIGKWIKTSTASHAKLTITDSAGSTSSSFHTGGGTYEWLEVTRAINASATSVAFYVYGDIAQNVDGTTIIYHCQGMLVFGSHIGEGNYAPKPHDFILGEIPIQSNTYHAKGGLSDLAFTDLNIEADSDAKIPKGIKAILVHTGLHDIGSAATAHVGLELRSNSTFSTMSYVNIVSGKANDLEAHVIGKQGCDENGDVDIKLSASGAGDLDIDMFEYHGVLLN